MKSATRTANTDKNSESKLKSGQSTSREFGGMQSVNSKIQTCTIPLNKTNKNPQSKKAAEYLTPRMGQSQTPSNIDPDLKDIQQFVEKWGISFKFKNAYTRSEVADLLRSLSHKLLSLDEVTIYERKKASEYREESRLLNEQLEKQKEEVQ